MDAVLPLSTHAFWLEVVRAKDVERGLFVEPAEAGAVEYERLGADGEPPPVTE